MGTESCTYNYIFQVTQLSLRAQKHSHHLTLAPNIPYVSPPRRRSMSNTSGGSMPSRHAAMAAPVVVHLDSFRPDRPLAESIALATRSVHARLNKLIVSRLPLALPPRASDPVAFLTGLLHIAPIYTTFEEQWSAILDAPPPPTPPSSSSRSSAADSRDNSLPDGCHPEVAPLLYTGGSHPLPREHDDDDEKDEASPKLHKPRACGRMYSMLQHLHLPGLMRSERLRADIQTMTSWPEHVVEEQLRQVRSMGYLAEFVSHIKRAIANKPHVLVAYAYIMFMALFAGGRFIRASLESAGEPFWAVEPSPARPTMRASERRKWATTKSTSESRAHDLKDDSYREEEKEEDTSDKARPTSRHNNMPLHFFHFDTPVDGEDLKREFKQRLVDSEEMLTPQEKRDIVQEAVCIFENVTLVVLQLDSLFPDHEGSSNGGDASSRRESSLHSLASLLRGPLANRFRDSVVVTKERKERSSSKRSSGHEESNCPIVANPKLSEKSSAASMDGTAAVVPQSQPSPPSLPQDDHNCEHNAYKQHPNVISDTADVELCPAFAKSMRFDGTLELPARSSRDDTSLAPAAEDLPETLRMACKQLSESRMAHWVVVVAFGVIFLGAMVASQRAVKVEIRP
ncbi:hypothetical protein JDV02_004957 [Purpureocillium takamizusanense]|uniref:Hem oxygenase-like, multi-helical n=1 Tax=Purpureocillium takamizusanense TaxID=2060973 RepID=A0A9Q8QG94_9HYPO|nr:uncharacterized protein JDV02_004957 [Purpureocillium takamizusanense]UNI18702.1 hypothetical protein JDV02_004957 [Purpureocillium takamizusanense]